MEMRKKPPKALFFDVFGTVVDWRRTVVAHLASRCDQTLKGNTSIPSATRARAQQTAWADFAQEWRAGYNKFTASFVPGETPYKTIDEYHYDSLQELLKQHDLDGLWPISEVEDISKIWHYLDAWPDASQGIKALNELGLETSTLSNGNTSLLTDLTRHADLSFTVITSAEEFAAYKPHPSVYRGACMKLGLEPEECMMVAAHLRDLQAARGSGLRTAYVEREGEEAWSEEQTEETRKSGWVDVWVAKGDGNGGILKLASILAGKG